MTDLAKLSNELLMTSTKRAVKIETEATHEVIRHFQEIFDRKLYLEKGYASMFVMVTEVFEYSPAAAQERINAMKLIIELPELGDKLESGELNLTTASMMQSFFQAEAKEDKPYSRGEKFGLIEELETKSTREIKRELAKLNPKFAQKDSCRFLDGETVELRFAVAIKTNDKLTRLRELRSHVNPNMTFGELIDWMADLALEKTDPIQKAQRAEKREAKKLEKATSQTTHDTAIRIAPEVKLNHKPHPVSENVKDESRSRYIRASENHTVHRQNAGQSCAYVDPITNKKCGSRFFLQRDHKIPFSRGGSNEAGNLRLLCSQHNRWIFVNPERRCGFRRTIFTSRFESPR